jgi:hypothetical protein
MSRGELTDAYVRGRISRRSFVRGMVALGASVTTAVAMADSLSAAPGGTPVFASSDVYDDPPKDPGETAGGVTVAVLPSTGTSDGAGTSATSAVVAAGAAAAAVIALRARHGKKAEDEA